MPRGRPKTLTKKERRKQHVVYLNDQELKQVDKARGKTKRAAFMREAVIEKVENPFGGGIGAI